MKTLETLSICIVDDDELFLNALKHYLQEKIKTALTFKLFRSGEEFLKNATEQKFDIVILDYVLNGTYPYAMDGVSVLKKFKQANPETTIIVLSAQCKIEVALESIREGAYDYVVKNDNAFMKIKNVVKNIVPEVIQLKQTKKWKHQIIALAVAISSGLIIGMILRSLFL